MKILDFIKQSSLQELQDLFSTATGLAAIAVDAEGNYITKGSNFTDFCMKHTRQSKVGKQRCEKCDVECSGTYFCHAGLMDFSEDITINGEKIGAIIGGQVLPVSPDISKFELVADELSIPRDKYIAALKKVPIKSESSIRAGAKLLGEIINTLVNLEYMKNSDHNALSTIEEEIKNALISAKAIKDYSGRLEGIASKQNILSLNASIEAARSGLVGAGFAVVAGQMGVLAKDSSGIYDNIKKNSNSIYESMSNMSKSMKQ